MLLPGSLGSSVEALKMTSERDKGGGAVSVYTSFQMWRRHKKVTYHKAIAVKERETHPPLCETNRYKLKDQATITPSKRHLFAIIPPQPDTLKKETTH